MTDEWVRNAGNIRRRMPSSTSLKVERWFCRKCCVDRFGWWYRTKWVSELLDSEGRTDNPMKSVSSRSTAELSSPWTMCDSDKDKSHEFIKVLCAFSPLDASSVFDQSTSVSYFFSIFASATRSLFTGTFLFTWKWSGERYNFVHPESSPGLWSIHDYSTVHVKSFIE